MISCQHQNKDSPEKSMRFEEGSKPFLDDYDGFPTRDGIYLRRLAEDDDE
jgi:hypothetical protein